MFHGRLDSFQKPPLGGRPNTKLGDRGTPNAHNCWFILFCHVRGPAWIDIHWPSKWLRARSFVTSHYTRGSVTTRHGFGGVLGQRPLDTFFWALTISWSRLLARVWSGPKVQHPFGCWQFKVRMWTKLPYLWDRSPSFRIPMFVCQGLELGTNTCTNEIELCAQSINSIIGSIVNIFRITYYSITCLKNIV